jgi:enediyne biosynthesis protein CalE5
MIAFAQGRARGAGYAPRTFRLLALDDSAVLNQTFDAALCRFGLMFADDVALTLGRIHGVLRPGARFVAALWSAPQRVPLIGIAMRAVAAALGGRRLPATARRRFASLTEPLQSADDFRHAGFENVSFVETTVSRTFVSAREYAEMSAAIAPPIAGLIRADESRRELVLHAIEQAASAAFGPSEMTISGDAFCAVGTASGRLNA